MLRFHQIWRSSESIPLARSGTPNIQLAVNKSDFNSLIPMRTSGRLLAMNLLILVISPKSEFLQFGKGDLTVLKAVRKLRGSEMRGEKRDNDVFNYFSKGGFMKRFEAKAYLVCMLIASVFLLSGCGKGTFGGGQWNNPDDTPKVTAVAPLPNATDVAINTKTITASFSQAMDPGTLTTASFKLSCNGTEVTGGGAVTYLAEGNVATLPLPAATNLPPLATCTARVTTAVKNPGGTALANDYVWNFITGVTPVTAKPLVTSTFPATTNPGPTANVPTNSAITATFNKDMDPVTINSPAANFTLTCPLCVSPTPAGNVSYAVGSKTATFRPTPAGTLLEAGKTYTATIKSAATDTTTNALAGNPALPLVANDYVWTFTTTAVAPSLPVSRGYSFYQAWH